MDEQSSDTIQSSLQVAIDTNKQHQQHIGRHVELLRQELEQLNRWLVEVDLVDEEDIPDVDVGGHMAISNGIEATSLVSIPDLLSANSPFNEDARRLQHYQSLTTPHMMKQVELDSLVDAVRAQNQRYFAVEAQRRGMDPFSQPDDQQYFLSNKEGINWDHIADSVNSARQSNVQRTAQELKVRWLGDLHPDINHGAWTAEERSRLQEVVKGVRKRGDKVDWVEAAKQLGTNRSPVDCLRESPRAALTFNDNYDRRLLEAVEKYGVDNWLLVARYVSPNATSRQCLLRYYRSLDPDIKHGTWSGEEDERLRMAVDAYGQSWIDVATLIAGRMNDQCRDRWRELNSSSSSKPRKPTWTAAEDKTLMSISDELGHQWAQVAEKIGGDKTAEFCRLRFNLLKRRAKNENAAFDTVISDINAPAHVGPIQIASPHTPTQQYLAPPATLSNRAQYIYEPSPLSEVEGSTSNLPTLNQPLRFEVPNQRPKPRPKPRTKRKGKSKGGSDVAAVYEEESQLVPEPEEAVSVEGHDQENPPEEQNARKRAASSTIKAAKGKKVKITVENAEEGATTEQPQDQSATDPQATRRQPGRAAKKK